MAGVLLIGIMVLNRVKLEGKMIVEALVGYRAFRGCGQFTNGSAFYHVDIKQGFRAILESFFIGIFFQPKINIMNHWKFVIWI